MPSTPPLLDFLFEEWRPRILKATPQEPPSEATSLFDLSLSPSLRLQHVKRAPGLTNCLLSTVDHTLRRHASTLRNKEGIDLGQFLALYAREAEDVGSGWDPFSYYDVIAEVATKIATTLVAFPTTGHRWSTILWLRRARGSRAISSRVTETHRATGRKIATSAFATADLRNLLTSDATITATEVLVPSDATNAIMNDLAARCNTFRPPVSATQAEHFDNTGQRSLGDPDLPWPTDCEDPFQGRAQGSVNEHSEATPTGDMAGASRRLLLKVIDYLVTGPLHTFDALIILRYGRRWLALIRPSTTSTLETPSSSALETVPLRPCGYPI